MRKLLTFTKKSFLSKILALTLFAAVVSPASFNGNSQGDVSVASDCPVKVYNGGTLTSP